ncbi:PREDICTED: max-like protein X isoform X1 [Myotis davidii]|nr:PREDICTED: max-like protein X isoform X1 [Myotis davidii]
MRCLPPAPRAGDLQGDTPPRPPTQPASTPQGAQPTPRVRPSLAAQARHPRPALSSLAADWLVWVTWARSLFLATSGRPSAGFRCGGSEMTEPGASLEDPWVKVEYAYSDNSLDPGLFVESSRKGSVVSRANSIGSTSASSVPNTDDEDSDYHQESYKESYKDRRRRAHTQAEQKRRDAIKRGYDDLQTIVPTCQQQDFSIGSQKLSKAIVLQKTIDYIQFLHKEKKKQEEEVSTLRKDVMALKIMKVNYEQIVKAHQDNPHEGEDQVSDQVKFNVFQGIMDALFQSFNASISMASFQELSACVFSWIEEHCKPQTLREIVIGVLHQLKNQLY